MNSNSLHAENVDVSVKGQPVRGFVAASMEPVLRAFIDNFAGRGEVGAACAVYRGKEVLVDLYGGNRESGSEWTADTMACVHSSTKAISAVAMAMAVSRGYIELDAPIATYWPEFASQGKGKITARQLFAHSAGLPIIEETISLSIIADFDALAEILARQKPQWEPGSKMGYHGWSLGFYQNEILRRTDPAHRTIGRFIAEEIAAPLGVEFYIGLPDTISDGRIANEISSLRSLRETIFANPAMLLGLLLPDWLAGNKLGRQMLNTIPELANVKGFHSNAVRRIEIPSGNGIGTARAMARIMGACAVGGAELGIDQKTREELERSHPRAMSPPKDALLGVPTVYQMGFSKPGTHYDLNGHTSGYFAPGSGGNMCFADPESGIGFGYAINRMGGYIMNDPRERALREAVFSCVR
jgi:CubicO group peptidase (beta-lactamase class C family)